MRGSIKRRGKAWRIVVEAGIDPVTGKRRQTTATVHGTKQAAEDRLNEMLGDARAGVNDGHDATVGQLIDTWFERVKLAPSARADYRSAIKCHIPTSLRAMPVWKVRTHHLDRLYHDLESKVGPARIRRVHNILRSAFGQAVKWEWIRRNPAHDASPPPVTRAPIRPPGVDDVVRILSTADGALRTYLILAANLGARRGEICALQWADINLDAGEIRISRAWSDGGKGVGMVLKATKTDRERTIAIDEPTVAALKVRRAELAALALRTQQPIGRWVICLDELGVTPIRPDGITHRFSTLRTTLKLKVTVKDFRHFVITQLLAAGVDVGTVSGRAGHKRTSTTYDIYGHFIPAKDRQAADTMGKILAG